MTCVTVTEDWTDNQLEGMDENFSLWSSAYLKASGFSFQLCDSIK